MIVGDPIPVDPSVFVLLIVFADSVLLNISFFVTITIKKKKTSS